MRPLQTVLAALAALSLAPSAGASPIAFSDLFDDGIVGSHITTTGTASAIEEGGVLKASLAAPGDALTFDIVAFTGRGAFQVTSIFDIVTLDPGAALDVIYGLDTPGEIALRYTRVNPVTLEMTATIDGETATASISDPRDFPVGTVTFTVEAFGDDLQATVTDGDPALIEAILMDEFLRKRLDNAARNPKFDRLTFRFVSTAANPAPVSITIEELNMIGAPLPGSVWMMLAALAGGAALRHTRFRVSRA